ncbi:MAG: TonB-dependent receptor [Pseudomonadota bacterium]
MKFGSKLAFAASAAALVGGGVSIAQDSEQDAADEEPRMMERVVTTGSLIQRDLDPFDSASPISNVGRDSFDESAILTSSELFRQLTFNTGSENQANALIGGNNIGTANVNLRGLGLGSTLVLVNGRRQTVSSAVSNRGDTFVDLNTLLPQIMIGNIEVLKEGAAATYGSDAVAGVVNFRTRNDFEGLEVRADYQATTRGDNSDTLNVSAIFGAQGDRGGVVGAISYITVDELATTDRDFPFQTNSTFGNPGSFLLLAPSPTIPDAVPGTFNADPECGGPNAPATFAVPDGAGSLCIFDFGPSFTLVPESQRTQVYVTGDYEIATDHRAFFEAGFTSSDGESGFSPSFPNLAFPLIGADHPGNPYGVPVLWRGRAIGDGGLEPGENRVIGFANDETYRLVAGVDGDIAETGFGYSLAYTYSRDRREVSVNDQIGSRLNAALQGLGGPDCDVANGTPGVGGCQFFNPFGTALTTVPNDPALVDFITNDDPSLTRTDLQTIDFVVNGDLFELPGGTLAAAVGYQFRREIRDTNNPSNSQNEDLVFLIGTPDSRGSRTINAVFGELAIPVFNNDQLGEAEIQAAIRYEDYSTGQSSTDPKVAVRWSPRDFVTLRGSYSTSFRAPTLFQITNQQTALNATLDPLTGSLVFLAETALPNPDLASEEARSFNLGFSVEPIENLVFNFDYYNVNFDNLISVEIGQQLIIAEAAALGAAGCGVADISGAAPDPTCLALRNEQIIRDPLTGTALRIFTSRENAPTAETDGIDISMTYSHDIGRFGVVGIANDTTFVNSFDITTPDGTVLTGAGARNANTPFANSIPRWRSNTTLSWALDRHSINAVGRFISSYDEEDGAGEFISDVDSWFTVDLQYNYELEDVFGFGDGTTLSVGAQNLFDRDPPFVTGQSNDFGYDTTVHDPRGRLLYVRVSQRFN